MSTTIDQSFVTQWSDEAHIAFQATKSHLRDAIRVHTGVVGDTYRFHKLGAVNATSNSARGATIQPQNPSHSYATATLTDAILPIHLANFDQLRTNLNLKKDYTDTVLAGMNRELDSRIISAMSASTNTVTTGSMDAAKIAALHKALNKKAVPKTDRYLVISAGALEDMQNDSKLASNDFLNRDLISTGIVKGVSGFTVIIPDDESILPVDTTGKHTCFAFHKSCVGLAIGQDLKLEIEKRTDLVQTWQLLGSLFCGATAIDINGIFKVEIGDD